MANDTTSGRIRLRGIQHPPEADIQNIRDLLQGYGSGGSLMKELIQNAEDAQAKHLDLILAPGYAGATHPLLRSPALCAVNDGEFEPRHREAIFRLGLGTKGADPRAIGRFGKGLKSVFALCEAFFITARTNHQNGWNPGEPICDFFNPWNGWRHADWDDAFDGGTEAVFSHVAQEVAAFGADCPHWLAFWLPLRHPGQKNDVRGPVAWIHESSAKVLPGEDEMLGEALTADFKRLAPSLVTLRNLRRIRLIDARSGKRIITEWSVHPESDRCSEPGTMRETEYLTGTLILSNASVPAVNLEYVGYAGTLPEITVAGARARNGWPTVVDISESGSTADQKAKGEPHYATILTTQPASAGNLELRWSVFFPVSEQPDGIRSVPLARIKQNITLNLHGFFFLDTERRRVDGLQQHFADCNHACLEWNQIVATEGTLSNVPRALASFAEQQNLGLDQSAELAQALRQMWAWSKFGSAICRHYTWRPRWRLGNEQWELIPADSAIFLIPRISDSAGIFAKVPRLAKLSESVTLVTQESDGQLPGIHSGKWHKWPEKLVMEVLDGVQLSPTGDEVAADWLNEFLSRLNDANSLTPAIRERIYHLPLLPVREARSGTQLRISAREWENESQLGNLFSLADPTNHWLRLLLAGLPEWSCRIAYRYPPPWFIGHHPSSLDAHVAANAVLSQSRLGQFPALAELVRNFVAHPVMPETLRLAVRFLMHGHAGHAADGEHFLFMPSTQTSQLIWSRLIKQLLIHEGGENSWRLLHQQWASVFSSQVQQDLKITTIDQQGAWEELMTATADFTSMDFPLAEWGADDVATLLYGLFQAGKIDIKATIALLRKLRLHTLRGQPGERVGVAGADGKLGELFVLNRLNFEESIPTDLSPIWERFLTNTKIVERIQDGLATTVQEKIFRTAADDGEEYDATLDWNYVVRRCLEFPDTSAWAPLIMEALSHGDQAVQGLGAKLKRTEWLPLSDAGNLAPDSIIVIDGLEAEIHQLLDPTVDGLAGIHALSKAIVAHNGFATLKKYFPNLEGALDYLAHWLKDKPNWHLGLVESSLPSERDKFLFTLETIEEIPGAELLAKLTRLPSQARNSGWSALLWDTIWQSALSPFPFQPDGSSRLERVLQRLTNNNSRYAFDAYLRQAVAESQINQLLPRLRLMNQKGQWIPANKLIWPSVNLDTSVQLCAEHAEILETLRSGTLTNAGESNPEGGGDSARQGTSQPPNQASQSPLQWHNFEWDADSNPIDPLKKYLRGFCNSNVGTVLPAALVAMMSGTSGMKDFLSELLQQSGLGLSSDDFVTVLLSENMGRVIEAIKAEKFEIQIVQGNQQIVKSITGENLTVNLSEEITSLIVGDPYDIWRRHGNIAAGRGYHRVSLRTIEKPDDLADPVDVFAATIETILLRAHCNGDARLCPTNIKAVLSELNETGQTDLRRSQFYLLDMAEARLKELAVQEDPSLKSVLDKYRDARQARVDAELLQRQAPARAHQRTASAAKLSEEAKDQLLKILMGDNQVQPRLALVAAIRRKMTDFQYSPESVALELFQNADDAVAEWAEMRKTIHKKEQQFVISLNEANRSLEFIHWGRPINRHTLPGFQSGLQRGYDQDLQKMLTLNFSDKGVCTDGQPAIVTGRFGLGFKTVFFVTDEPEVVSDRLAFQIRGGFYPIPLAPDKAGELREWADKMGVLGLSPTVIRLKWSHNTDLDELTQAFAAFRRIAPILTVFSRQIRSLKLEQGGNITDFVNEASKFTSSDKIAHVQVANQSFLCFRCQLKSDQRPASVLFALNSSGVSNLPNEIPRLWITTPTAEHSDLGWALNAPFKPDAGRQRLALNNPTNRQIADEVAHAWHDALIDLSAETEDRWEDFAIRLGLHSSITVENWCLALWNEMTRTVPVLKWDQLRDGGQVLGYIAWGHSIGAMRRLIQTRAAIPTKLPGKYDSRIKNGDVCFTVEGLLAELANGCFALISEWASVQKAYPPGKTVNSGVFRFLQEIGSAENFQTKLTLRDALVAELGNELQINHLTGDRLGHFFINCRTLFLPTSQYAPEVQPLLTLLNGSEMLASDNNYHPVTKLVSARSIDGLIEKDEPLRAAFAPRSLTLSNGYADSALHFFVKARGQLAANATTLAGWVNQSSAEQLPAIFHYLIAGELGQQLADELKLPWLEAKRSTPEYVRLDEAQKSELERKFFKGQTWIQPLIIAPLIPEIPPATQLMQADVAFTLVSKWWVNEHARHTAAYEAKTYPLGFPGKLPWPGEDAWDGTSKPSAQSSWLLLFIQAALVPLGFNRIGRDQSFTRFLIEKNWVEILARVSEDPHALFTALDNYLGAYIQNTEFHFQMRQFISFYAVSRNLDSFLLSLKAAEQSDQPDAFNHVFSPKANPVLSGTGIDAPPLGGMLGMGTCQLLRELYRLGRLKNPHGYQFAFTPIRKVRRLSTQLFGTTEGYAGAAASVNIFNELQALGTELNLDSTFNHCFDLPLQILAENKALRTRVLEQEFEAEAADSIELDAAPNDFSYQTL
jgi:hypothetical protein